MNIGLDYDGTYTNDRDLWRAFVRHAQINGHCVYVVTMRTPLECLPGVMDSWFADHGVQVIATNRTAKRPACEKLGINIHIWIDDNPKAVDADAMSIWGTSVPEGTIIDPQHDADPPRSMNSDFWKT
jgi:hypothetical protein